MNFKRSLKLNLAQQLNCIPNQEAINIALRIITCLGATVVQVGANDGEQNDPFYPMLSSINSNFYRIEPIPFYVDKLKKLHKNDSNVIIIQALIGTSQTDSKSLYYIDPKVADEMNGSGPNNNWAHGQGSIDKRSVINNIFQNRFRGANYRKNISRYIKSILQIELPVLSFSDLVSVYGIKNIDLLAIDVQGGEKDIIESMFASSIRPSFLLIENDPVSNKSSLEVKKLLLKNSYTLMIDSSDQLYVYN